MADDALWRARVAVLGKEMDLAAEAFHQARESGAPREVLAELHRAYQRASDHWIEVVHPLPYRPD